VIIIYEMKIDFTCQIFMKNNNKIFIK